MKIIRHLALYMALALGANAAFADMSAIEALREGDMKRLNFHSEPRPVSEIDFEGKYLLVNFWATWCAPCRAEMPMLSELQAELGGENFEVVTIASGPNPEPAMDKFFDEIGVDNLPRHRDPNSRLSRDMGVLALPITVIVDPEGMEIARLQGDAEWNSESAKAIIRALAGQDD